MHVHARAGNIEASERLLQEMRDDGVEANTIVFNALLDACAKTMDVCRAERWFTEMQQSGCELTPASFNTMINTCAKCGDLPGAERWEAGIAPTIVTYTSLACPHSKQGDWQRVEA